MKNRPEVSEETAHLIQILEALRRVKNGVETEGDLIILGQEQGTAGYPIMEKLKQKANTGD